MALPRTDVRMRRRYGADFLCLTLYIAVVTETNNPKIPAKLNDAEAAIFNRLQALNGE
jgi:hypothetical protein